MHFGCELFGKSSRLERPSACSLARDRGLHWRYSNTSSIGAPTTEECVPETCFQSAPGLGGGGCQTAGTHLAGCCLQPLPILSFPTSTQKANCVSQLYHTPHHHTQRHPKSSSSYLFTPRYRASYGDDDQSVLTLRWGNDLPFASLRLHVVVQNAKRDPLGALRRRETSWSQGCSTVLSVYTEFKSLDGVG